MWLKFCAYTESKCSYTRIAISCVISWIQSVRIDFWVYSLIAGEREGVQYGTIDARCFDMLRFQMINSIPQCDYVNLQEFTVIHVVAVVFWFLLFTALHYTES